MTIWDLCIKRPVFTVMLVSAPLVMGAVCYMQLGVDLFPNVDFPVVTVTTALHGASVEEMETCVTKPIEDIINTVSGIDELRSTTKEGISKVTVQFLLSKNGDVGTQEVRDKVNTILAKLPAGTEPPIIDKFDINAVPVMTIAVSGRATFREVTEIARKQIKERLETVTGVGAIILVGGRQRAMNIMLDTDKLAAYNLSIEDVRLALVRQNLEVPGGRVDQGPASWSCAPWAAWNTPPSSTNLIVANRNGYPIRIHDIGRVGGLVRGTPQPGPARRRERRQPGRAETVGHNTVKVVDDVKKRLDELNDIASPRHRDLRGHATSRGSSGSRSRR